MCQKGSNYILINETKNWCEALGYCRRHFTDLAIINNQQEADYVLSRSMGTRFWIGLLHDEWRWVDQSCSTYRTWNNISQTENCSVMSSDTGRSFKRHDCEGAELGLCSKGNVRIKVITSPQLSWEESLEYCEANHSRLLWIEGEEDQKAVEQWLNYTHVQFSYPLWISMRQSSVFGFWIWSDRIVNWTNWENGRQPELNEPFQCGVIKKDFTWSNRSCSTQLPFICEEDIVWMNE
ncbi:C-type mannose receptor 2 [Melanotaenia boesemani]|uniref:C-type mannose receptor 2 n=1 Tax=Melanotaenia boesemani TaxID=1250792 RepID=UPI001C03C877|nr:C-type mannose receptor 2 [Melanotaenia boesemani]